MKHKKILSIFLVIMMLVGMLPQMSITAFAEEIGVVDIEIKEPLLESVPLIISGGAYVGEYSWNAIEVTNEGITYKLTIEVCPDGGNQFNQRTVVTINGKEINWGSWNSDSITVYYEYFVEDKLGTNPENPVWCTNFSELKFALEDKDIIYITLKGNITETLPYDDSKFGLWPAIAVSGEKVLTLEGTSTFSAPAISSEDYYKYKSYYSLIHVMSGGNLTINGTGSLEFRNCLSNGQNAVIYNDGYTTINGGTLIGSYNVAVYGMAIWQNAGVLTINDGGFIGYNAYSDGRDKKAVYVCGGVTRIYGGTFMSYNEYDGTGDCYGLYIDGNYDVLIYGGRIYGINIPEKCTISDYMDYMCYAWYDEYNKVTGKENSELKDCATDFFSKKVVENVNLSIDAPEPGKIPSKSSIGIKDDGYSVYSIDWYDITEKRYMEEEEAFVAGHEYKAYVCLKISSYYVFAINNSTWDTVVTGTVNDEEVAVNNVYEQDATNIIEISYDCGICKKKIENVAVEFNDLGKPIYESEPIVVSQGSYVDQYQWNSVPYLYGKKYSLIVLIKAENGYEFFEETNIVVNGEEPVLVSLEEKSITVEYEYYVVDEKVVTEMEIKNLQTPIAGETIDTLITVGESDFYKLDENYGFGGAYWYDSEGNTLDEDYKFVEGETYQVELKIVPVSYKGMSVCTFDPKLKVTANGTEPSQLYAMSDKVYVYFDFLCVGKENEELTAAIKADNNVTKVNVGEEVIYRGLATGGTGDYTYKFALLDVKTNQWTILSDFSKKSEFVYKANKAGTYQFAMTVKDSSGAVLSAKRADLVVEDVKPLVGTLKVNNNTEKITIAAGSNLTLNASATGGSGVYTYKYALLNTKTGAWNVFKNFTAVDEQSYVIKVVGTYQFACTVKDNKGETVSANRVTVVVEEAKALAGTLKVNGGINTVTAKSGTDLVLTTDATGGSGNYTYKYAMLNLKTGVWTILKDFNADNKYVLSKVGAGSYQFAATVKDNVGKTVSATRVTVNVESSGETLKGMLKVNGSTDKLTVNIGDDLTLTPVATGGDGNYTYKYAMLNTKTNVWTVFKDFSTAKEYLHRTKAEGTYQLACTVKDGTGKTVATNRVTVVVEKALEPLSGTLTVNGSKDKLTVNKGTKITLTANATGGSENYTYKFAVLNVDNGKWSVLKDFSSASTYTYALNYPGTKEFAVTIKDSKGTTVATNRLVVVVK